MNKPPTLPDALFFRHSLREGCKRLQLNTGIVSRVVDDYYYVVESHGSNGAFNRGDVFPLKDTWCRTVIEKQRTVALCDDHSPQSAQHHPMYQSLPLQAYISTPIWCGDKVWGTLNFSNLLHGHPPFNDDDIGYIEQLAQSMSPWLDSGDSA